MQHELPHKIPGRDISYPVINRQHSQEPERYIIEDDDRDQVCDCAGERIAIVITGLLNKHKPQEWVGGPPAAL